MAATAAPGSGEGDAESGALADAERQLRDVVGELEHQFSKSRLMELDCWSIGALKASWRGRADAAIARAGDAQPPPGLSPAEAARAARKKRALLRAAASVRRRGMAHFNTAQALAIQQPFELS